MANTPSDQHQYDQQPVKPKRDSQRSKVYAAESVIQPGRDPEFRSIEACQRYVDHIMATKTWQKLDRTERWGRGIRVHDGRGHRRAVSYGGTIALPLWARQKGVILHELAHEILQGSHTRGESVAHGWQFCSVYLKLVSRFMGRKEAAKLKASFKKHRVRFTEPQKRKPLTEAQRQVLRERLVAARAAKAAKAAE